MQVSGALQSSDDLQILEAPGGLTGADPREPRLDPIQTKQNLDPNAIIIINNLLCSHAPESPIFISHLQLIQRLHALQDWRFGVKKVNEKAKNI